MRTVTLTTCSSAHHEPRPPSNSKNPKHMHRQDPKHAILKALTQHLFQRRRHRLHRDDEVTKVVSRGDRKFSESGHSAIRVNFLDIPFSHIFYYLYRWSSQEI